MTPHLDFDSLPDSGLIRPRDVVRPRGPVPISIATLWRWIAAGRFVQPVKITPRVTAFRVGDVREWLATTGVAH